MTVEVTTAEFNEVLLDADVQALIVQKLSAKKIDVATSTAAAEVKSIYRQVK